MSGSSHVNLSFSGPVVHEKKIFKWPTPLFCTSWISLRQEWFVPSLFEIGQLFHFKSFFLIYTCKNCFPYYVLSQPSGTITYTSLNLHYMACWFREFFFSILTHVNTVYPILAPPDPRGPCFEQIIWKLSCIFELFWLRGSWERRF
jgi:hypothetical protein